MIHPGFEPVMIALWAEAEKGEYEFRYHLCRKR